MTEDTLTYIGTATVILEINGIKILVDPAFFHGKERVHMGWGLFSKRLVPPAISVDEVKPDLILITHTHNDHYDDAAKNGLSKDIPIITNHKAASTIRKDGFKDVTGIRLEEVTEFKGLKITALPARHGPIFMRPFVGYCVGFGIEFGEHKLWVSGDTIGFDGLRKSLSRYQPKTGVVYFGGVKAYGIRLTFNGKDAANTLNDSTIRKIHGVHVDDWTHFKTKKEDIARAFEENEIDLSFPDHGEMKDLW